MASYMLIYMHVLPRSVTDSAKTGAAASAAPMATALYSEEDKGEEGDKAGRQVTLTEEDKGGKGRAETK